MGTWFQSQQFCSTKGGYLAEIQSAEESDLVATVLNQETAFWIGLNDLANHGQWMWQHSVTPMKWSNWFRGQPNNSGGDQHCVDMYRDTNAKWGWKDENCDRSSFQKEVFFHALCEA